MVLHKSPPRGPVVLSLPAQRTDWTAQAQALTQKSCPAHGTELRGIGQKTEITTDVRTAETGKQKGQ